MTRTEIKERVQKKTENTLVDQVDYDALLDEIMQEFCSEHRFWWRKKRFTFATVGGTDSYDLTDTTNVVTTPADIGPYVEEITYVGRVDGTKICDVDPIFDDAAIAEWSVDTTQDKPGIYTIESNDLQKFQTLRLHKTPNGVYTMHVFAWLMPNPSADSASDDQIYVVPSIWHHALQTGLEKEIWRLAYGEENPKYGTALALYNKKVAAAKVQPGFSTRKTQDWHRKDGNAIRSTR